VEIAVIPPENAGTVFLPKSDLPLTDHCCSPCSSGLSTVVPGFRPGIHVSRAAAKAWMAGSTPGSSPGAAMTAELLSRVPDISPIYQGGKGGSIAHARNRPPPSHSRHRPPTGPAFGRPDGRLQRTIQ
jgi:hypothetical protein